MLRPNFCRNPGDQPSTSGSEEAAPTDDMDNDEYGDCEDGMDYFEEPTTPPIEPLTPPIVSFI